MIDCRQGHMGEVCQAREVRDDIAPAFPTLNQRPSDHTS